MGIAEDFQQLGNIYYSAIARIRIIRKNGQEDLIILPQPGHQTGPVLMGIYQNDFDAITVKYAREIKEVRVILRNDSGASQFFPPGTPESVVWGSTITKEELDG